LVPKHAPVEDTELAGKLVHHTGQLKTPRSGISAAGISGAMVGAKATSRAEVVAVASCDRARGEAWRRRTGSRAAIKVYNLLALRAHIAAIVAKRCPRL
jgi:hypothetical protein